MVKRAAAEAEDSTGESTSAWVLAAQAGSRGAMAQLHERYAPTVHAIVLAHGLREDAADLTQQAFVTAIKRLNTLRDPAAFGPWVGQIARNASRDHLRRQRPQTTLENYEPTANAQGPPRVDAQRVVQAIRALPDQQAEILMMRLLEGLNGPEIAQRMQLKAGTVRVALHRGMAKLRERLADQPTLERSSA